MIIWPAKDPGATEKFAFDFTDFLNGDTISGSPTVTGDGVTVTAVAVDGAFVRFKLSGGIEGTVAKVACTIVTSAGETIPALGVLEIGGEAVSLATAKLAQRIEGDDEDALCAAYLRAAIGSVEARTARNLTPKIVTQTVDGFPPGGAYAGIGYPIGGTFGALGYPAGGSSGLPCGASATAIRLFKGPVAELLSVKYDDANGIEQELASFRLVEGGSAGSAKLLPAYGASWPVTAIGLGSVRLTYVAGYDPAQLPPELTQAAILLFGHYYANREAALVDSRAAAVEIPLGVEALLAAYTLPGIA